MVGWDGINPPIPGFSVLPLTFSRQRHSTSNVSIRTIASSLLSICHRRQQIELNGTGQVRGKLPVECPRSCRLILVGDLNEREVYSNSLEPLLDRLCVAIVAGLRTQHTSVADNPDHDGVLRRGKRTLPEKALHPVVGHAPARHRNELRFHHQPRSAVLSHDVKGILGPMCAYRPQSFAVTPADRTTPMYLASATTHLARDDADLPVPNRVNIVRRRVTL